MIRFTTLHATMALLTVSMSACSWGVFRGYAEGPSERLTRSLEAEPPPGSPVRFMFDDLGGLNTDALETHAIPWKVVTAALLVDRLLKGNPVALEPESLPEVFREFGFITPDTILNWHGPNYPGRLSSPVGLVRGTAHRGFPRVEIEVANLSCAACHTGVAYDKDGTPRNAAWLGMPNTSLKLGAYTKAIYEALLQVVDRPTVVLAAIDEMYPEISADERQTIVRHLFPRITDELTHLRATLGGLVPYGPGGPGRANGLGSLSHVLGIEHEDLRATDAGTAGIPDLGDRMLRTALTSDAVYGVPGRPRFAPMTPADVTDEHLDGLAGVAAFFTVPAMGVRPEKVGQAVPRVREILDFVHAYRPPAFPGEVDRMEAERGREVYQVRCAGCHGDYGADIDTVKLRWYPNHHVLQEDLGTDPHRWQSATLELAELIGKTAYGGRVDPARTGGYVAPPLTGLWASAPYLHNGSVPTLWHLMRPEQRPEQFDVGGHRLDFDRVGIDGKPDATGTLRYPDGYVPWTSPETYDVHVAGQSNAGHEVQFEGLTEEQKRALLEYLKLL